MSNVPLVAVVMGSRSDLDVMEECVAALRQFCIPHEVRVISAHRTPDVAHEFGTTARERGLRAIICAAGKAAHLAGVMASLTTLPVIGVPMTTSDLGGLDSLLSTVQMPGGIPVATTAIGKAGAKNAALFAAAILSVENQEMADRLRQYRAEMQESVRRDDETVRREHAG